VACIFVFTACLKDRVFPPTPIPPGSNANLKAGFIKINEIQNDFDSTKGDKADWVEIYNTTDSALILEPGRFWMTDEKNQKFQYSPIRRYSIPAKSFFIVYFQNNGLDDSQSEITNIEGSLSSNGEFAGFYFLTNDNDTITLDTVTFPASTSQNETYGRLPDGTGAFQKLKTITRNASNNVNKPIVVVPLDTLPEGLKINEIRADFKDSIAVDSGDLADWVELYNSSDKIITLKKDQFWISNKKATLAEYTIQRSYNIAPGGFLTIYFKNGGTDNSNDHILYPNGNLDKDGEFVSFSFKKKNGEVVIVDSSTFPAFSTVNNRYQTWGRFPDGGTFKWLRDISRNASNNKNGVIVPPVEPYAGMFVINEIAPAETSFDWVELKSQLSVPFVMKKGRWFVSDSGTIATRIDLNVDFTFFPDSYPVVTCSTTVASTIDSLRATFGLNKKADMFRIEYKKDDGQFLPISQYSYKYPSDILSNKTISRKSNGTYQENTEPSKGKANP
jgi:hypothetical protein